MFDLYLAKVPFSEAYGSKIFALTNDELDNKTVMVSGIYSVINKWIMAFLTPKYTDPLDMDYGTDFHQLISGAGDKSDLFATVQISIQEANSTLRRLQTGFTTDKQHIFKDATLNGIVTRDEGDGYDIYITVTNQNRDAITITVPTAIGLL